LGRQVEQARRVRAQRVQEWGQPRRRWLTEALSLRVLGGRGAVQRYLRDVAIGQVLQLDVLRVESLLDLLRLRRRVAGRHEHRLRHAHRSGLLLLLGMRLRRGASRSAP